MPPAASDDTREITSHAELREALSGADRVVISDPDLIRRAHALLGLWDDDRIVNEREIFDALSATNLTREAEQAPSDGVDPGGAPAPSFDPFAPPAPPPGPIAERTIRHPRVAVEYDVYPFSPPPSAPSQAPPVPQAATAASTPSRAARPNLLVVGLTTGLLLIMLAIAGAWFLLPASRMPSDPPGLPPPSVAPPSPEASAPPPTPTIPSAPSSPQSAPVSPIAPSFDPTVLIWPCVVLVGMLLAFLLVRRALTGEDEVTFTAQWKVHKLVDGRIELVRGKAKGRATRRRRAVAT
jgi:hypothetical protein